MSDRRGQPGVGPALRLAPGRRRGRSDPADRVGRAPAGERGGSHLPSPPLGGGCLQRGRGLPRRQGSRPTQCVHRGGPCRCRCGRRVGRGYGGRDLRRRRRRPRGRERWSRRRRSPGPLRLAGQPVTEQLDQVGGTGRPVSATGRTGPIMGDPGPSGRFGEFGGRFVPESLVPACTELEAAFRSAWSDRLFHAEFEEILGHYGGRPTPVTECGRLSNQLGVRVLLKARGPRPHRVPQTQQRGGPGSAGPADGKAPPHRRDRRRPARRGHRHGRRAVRHGVPGLHGRGGHPPTGAQRLSHGTPRRRGARRVEREPHLEGCRQRSPARLGGVGRGLPLLPRVGDGAAPVPVDGAGVPAGHRGRGPGAVPRAARRGRSRCGGGLRRRGIQRRRHLRRLRRRNHLGPGGGRGGRGSGHDRRRARGPPRHAQRG